MLLLTVDARGSILMHVDATSPKSFGAADALGLEPLLLNTSHCKFYQIQDIRIHICHSLATNEPGGIGF